MGVNALFGSSNLYDCVDVEDLFFLDVAIDGYSPGTSLEILCEVGGFVLVGGEFVEIVVVRYVFIGCLFFCGAEGTFLQAVNLGVGAGGERRSDEFSKITEGDSGDGGRSGDRCSGEEVAPVQVGRLGSNFRRLNQSGF